MTSKNILPPVSALLASLLLGATSLAQGAAPPGDELTAETLARGKLTHGGYGGPESKATVIMGDPAFLVGAQGGWIASHSFVVGIAGYGLVTRHEAPTALRVDDESSVLEMGYGGLRMAYLLQPHRLVHAGFGLLVGGGGVAAHTRYMHRMVDEDGEFGYEFRHGRSDAFFAIEPQVEAELNVTTFMRIALSGSYRFIGALEERSLSSADLSGPAAGLTLRFGAF